MSSRVMHFEVQADNIDRAKSFYEKALGWKIEKVMSAEDGGAMDYWMIETGEKGAPGINGGMYKRPQDEVIHTYDCTITVEDIDAAIAAIKECGGTIRREKSELPGVGWFARATDTEGNMFGLMQPTDWKPE